VKNALAGWSLDELKRLLNKLFIPNERPYSGTSARKKEEFGLPELGFGLAAVRTTDWAGKTT
jgi:hypothetical protein